MTEHKQPDRTELEAAARRLERFAEGENPRTIYKLPPNGRFDPMREDVLSLLSALRAVEGERDEAIRQRDIARNLHAAEIQFTDAATDRASTAEARVVELEGVVEWYANEENWRPQGGAEFAEIVEDGGSKARAMLSPPPGEEGGA